MSDTIQVLVAAGSERYAYHHRGTFKILDRYVVVEVHETRYYYPLSNLVRLVVDPVESEGHGRPNG